MKLTIPIRIESVANIHEHWASRAKRAREHRTDVWFALKAARAPVEVPVTITLTRIAPRVLDTDNLASGCKAARDGVADWLMVDDGDKRLTWVYAQRKGEPKEYALEVAFA